MAAISILAPGMTPAVSNEIEVAPGENVVVSIYTDTGEPIPYAISLYLQRKDVLDNFNDLSTLDYGFAALKRDSNMFVITTEGTYRVRRPDILAFGVNVGVQTG